MGISYLDGPRLRRNLIAAAEPVEAAREELNRINVVPELDRIFQPHECLVANAIAAPGVHVGPGACAVFHPIEESADAHSGTAQAGSAP